MHAQCTAYADHVCVCDSVQTGVRLLVFVCIMLWPTQVLRPQRKSIANNSTATGKEPYHPRGLWDRVYNQRRSVGGRNLQGSPCVIYSTQCPVIPQKTAKCLCRIPCFSCFSIGSHLVHVQIKSNVKPIGCTRSTIKLLIRSITLM